MMGKKLHPKKDGSAAVTVDGKFAGSLPSGKAKGAGNKESLELGNVNADFPSDSTVSGMSVDEMYEQYVLVPRSSLTPDAIAAVIRSADGSNELGAGALGEVISESLTAASHDSFAWEYGEMSDPGRYFASPAYAKLLDNAGEYARTTVDDVRTSSDSDFRTIMSSGGQLYFPQYKAELNAYNYGVKTVLDYVTSELPDGVEMEDVYDVVAPRLMLSPSQVTARESDSGENTEFVFSRTEAPLSGDVGSDLIISAEGHGYTARERQQEMFFVGMEDALAELRTVPSEY